VLLKGLVRGKPLNRADTQNSRHNLGGALHRLHAAAHLRVELGTEPLHAVFRHPMVGTTLHHVFEARAARLEVAIDAGVAAVEGIDRRHEPSRKE